MLIKHRAMPLIADFMIPLNPPVWVSTVYARHTALLSERDHQMCLVKLVTLEDMYGTKIFAVDQVTGEIYTVIEEATKKIDLQVYIDEEMGNVEEAIGFIPTDTSTPKDVEIPGKSQSQSSRPSGLSTIEEQTEVASALT